MPSALQVRRSKTGIRSTASLLAGVFILVLGWVINLCVIDAAFAHNHGKAKQILYINSYHPGYSWSDDIQKGLTQEDKRVASCLPSCLLRDPIRFPWI
jgi:hypothetical protein